MSDPELGSLDLDTLARIPVGVAMTDGERRITWANPALHDLLGGAPGALIGESLDVVLRGRSSDVRDGVSRHGVRDASGQRRWFEVAATPLRAQDAAAGTLHVVTDISEFETRGPGRLATALGTDLGGAVLDRKGILRELGAQVSRCRRYGNSLGVLLLRVSGSQGAEPTDDERQRVVARVNACVRWVDFVGAMADDELLVVMPETGADGASRVSAKLAEALGEQDEGAPPCPPSTIAIAEWTRDDDVDRLLARVKEELDAA